MALELHRSLTPEASNALSPIAYSVNDFAGFSILGSGLTIEATNDFCCGGFGGIIPGQSYTESFSADAGPGSFSTFEGSWGNTPITGNGSLSWVFDFDIPASTSPGSESEIEAAATVTGSFDFCSPPTFEEVSACGPGEDPLGSGTLSGTGVVLAHLNYDSQSGTYGSDEIYLTSYAGTANADIVPEPPSFFLFLGGLPLIWSLKRLFPDRARAAQPLCEP